MKSLLQEILDFNEGRRCLDYELYETYKNYLKGRLLQEFKTTDLNNVFILKSNNQCKVEQRIDAVIGLLKNTKYFEKDHGKKIPGPRTNLQLKNGNYCV